MQILNAAGQSYFGTAGLDISASRTADWVWLQWFEVLSLGFQLSLGATAISGELYLEYTPDPAKTVCITRVLLPSGSLHTNSAGISLLSNSTAISLAGVANEATGLCTFSEPAAGFYRWGWTYGSGGSAPNRMMGLWEGKED